MSTHTPGITKLIELFGRFPGIGARTAERMAYHLVRHKDEEARALSDAIVQVIREVGHCKACFNYAEGEQCGICADDRRDRETICVVEQESDVISIEKTGAYKGLYHVLLGRIAPMAGVGPEDIKIRELIERVKENSIQEVILATNPTMEGDTTAHYIAEQLAPTGVSVTRIARGLPAGSQLEYASKAIMSDAMEGRRQL